jgi:hypothetical protein
MPTAPRYDIGPYKTVTLLLAAWEQIETTPLHIGAFCNTDIPAAIRPNRWKPQDR